MAKIRLNKIIKNHLIFRTFVFIRRFVCGLVARLLSILLSASKIHVHSFLLLLFSIWFCHCFVCFDKMHLLIAMASHITHHTSKYDMKFYALVKFILYHYHVSIRTGTAKGINNNEHWTWTSNVRLLDYCMNIELTSWFKCRNSILMMKELMCVNSIVIGIWVYWFIYEFPMQLIDCDLPNLSLFLLFSFGTGPNGYNFSHNGILFKSLQMFKWVFPSFFNIFFLSFFGNQAFFIWICNCFQ